MTNTGFATNYFAELSLYIPGFQLGHGIYLYTGLEANNVLDEIKKQNGFNYLPLNVKPPRGYIDTLAFPSMEYMCSFKFNYAFPMFYPDWEWGDFLYLKRICCNAFADYAYVEGHKNYASFGAEITADFHLCNFIAPITSGVRLSKLSEPKISVMGFIFTSKKQSTTPCNKRERPEAAEKRRRKFPKVKTDFKFTGFPPGLRLLYYSVKGLGRSKKNLEKR